MKLLLPVLDRSPLWNSKASGLPDQLWQAAGLPKTIWRKLVEQS